MLKYNLDISYLLDGCLPRNPAVHSIKGHWDSVLREGAAKKPSLRFLDLEACSISRPHHLWTFSQVSLEAARYARVHARVLLGVYTLQANKSVFNQYAVDPTCPLCGTGSEDRAHFILYCGGLAGTRTPLLDSIRDIVLGWDRLAPSIQLQVIIDHGRVGHTVGIPGERSARLDWLTNQLLYRLHAERVRKLNN